MVGDIWKPGDGIPSIRIFKACEPDGGRKYLEDNETARKQLNQSNPPDSAAYDHALGDTQGLVVGNGDHPTKLTLPADYLSDVTEGQPEKYLLFEGTSPGKG